MEHAVLIASNHETAGLSADLLFDMPVVPQLVYFDHSPPLDNSVGSRSSSALRQPSGMFLRGTRTDFHDRLVFQPGHLLLHGIGRAHDLS